MDPQHRDPPSNGDGANLAKGQPRQNVHQISKQPLPSNPNGAGAQVRALAREAAVIGAARANPVEGLRTAADAAGTAAKAAEAAAGARGSDVEAYRRIQTIFARKSAAALLGAGLEVVA